MIDAYKQAKISEVDGERVEVLNSRVHQAYEALSRAKNRSVKACTDKLASMRDTYKFICDFEGTRIPGSTGQPPWFSLDKKERSTFLAKYKKVALSEEVYDALKTVLELRPTCNPHVLMDRNAQQDGFRSALNEEGAQGNPPEISEATAPKDNFTTGQAKRIKSKKRPREEDDSLEILRSIASDQKEMVQSLKDSQRETNEFLRQIAASLTQM